MSNQQQKGFKDPADKLKPVKEQEDVERAKKTFDISNLSMSDFKAIPKGMARSPHPFAGYPKKIMEMPTADGKSVQKVNMTYIVGLNPTTAVHQDPSGVGRSMIDPLTGMETTVTIPTTHNKVVVDYENGGINLDVEFGRRMKVRDGDIAISIVPSHSARAQICFIYNPKTKRIEENPDYVLLDTDQIKPLRRVFEMIINPKIKVERWAAAITDESDETLDELDVNQPLDASEG